MGYQYLEPDELFDSRPRKYSQAIVANDHLHLSGQVGIDETGQVVGDDIESQTTQAFENIGVLLDAVDRGFDDVVKITSYLVDIEQTFDAYKRVYAEFVEDGSYPCHTALGVEALASEKYLVELEVDVPLDEPSLSASAHE